MVAVHARARRAARSRPRRSPPRWSSGWQDRYRERLPLIDGAVEAVERLAARWPLAVASSSNRPLIDLVLELSGLDRLFRATVSSEEVARGKPAPDVYLEACRRLGVEPASGRGGRGLARRHRLGEGGRHARDRDPEPVPSRRARRRSPRRTSSSTRWRSSRPLQWRASHAFVPTVVPGTTGGQRHTLFQGLSLGGASGAPFGRAPVRRRRFSIARPKRTQPLWPPRPIAFESATSTCTRRASFGT